MPCCAQGLLRLPGSPQPQIAQPCRPHDPTVRTSDALPSCGHLAPIHTLIRIFLRGTVAPVYFMALGSQQLSWRLLLQGLLL